MPSRPDLRELAANVKEAFAEMDCETLLDILTFVVKEYVVEGPPPMLVHQAETLADLQGKTFAQLVQALQTRLDHPELSMFAVDGEQVSVRVGGVMQPLLAARQPLVEPGAGPGIRIVETNVVTRPPQPAPTPPAASAPATPGITAPPPARGVSVRGRPQAEAAGDVQAPAPAPMQPSQPAQPAAAGGQGQGQEKDKPEGSGDDASERFSLLELD